MAFENKEKPRNILIKYQEQNGIEKKNKEKTKKNQEKTKK